MGSARQLSPETVAERLGAEEENRSWQPRPDDEGWDFPFMRLWDDESGSKPDPTDRSMTARGPGNECPLNTSHARSEALKKHKSSFSRNFESPFISFHRSHDEIRNLANYRAGRIGYIDTPRRGPYRLIAIDPRVRIRAGLPVIHYKQEMPHYTEEKDDPKCNYTSHYACLWQVNADEVIGMWDWDELRKESSRDWYRDVVLRKFHDFRESRGAE